MDQLSLYDIVYDKYKITKPIRLIELFAGYGSQALALKYLGVPFEHYKICEWSIKSIQAYKDLHFTDIDVELNQKRTKDDMINFLYQRGISADYNKPMTKEQISRLSEEQLKTIIKNIAITHNLGNIQNIKGKDLEIVDTNKFTYLLTYSFPCQDLSLAGKKLGMDDTSTRSGLLWEVERILRELKELNSLPDVLLMENVTQIHNVENLGNFNKFKARLEELGYNNYFQDLIATDYGIPQTRNRCFMVSILGDYNYTFPKPIPLRLKLKDMLEDNVKEKYYLSDIQIQNIEKSNYTQNQRRIQDENICDTLCARDWKDPKCVTIKNKALRETIEQNKIEDTCYIDTYNKRIDKNKSGTITTGVSFRNHTFLAIKNATSKGYLEAEPGDGVDISRRMEYHRGTVQKGKAQTINTMGGEDVGVVVYE